MTLAERVQQLEEKKKLAERTLETEQKIKGFKWPFKWRRRFARSKKTGENQILTIYLNKKNEIEMPKVMPIFDGNMVIWKNKPYEFDPRAVWTIKGFRGNPKAYLIKEIDRRPVKNKFDKIIFKDAAVSNLDLDEIRERGDSTESDEFLIKAALRAQKKEMAKKKISAIVIIVILAVVAGIIFFFLKG